MGLVVTVECEAHKTRSLEDINTLAKKLWVVVLFSHWQYPAECPQEKLCYQMKSIELYDCRHNSVMTLKGDVQTCVGFYHQLLIESQREKNLS